jgi:tetratricopeptide (TPR) repeat protein
LLRELYVGRKTGLLSFTRRTERRSVRFISGNIVHGETNVEGGHLGECMVRHRLLTEAQLDKARSVAVRTAKRMGLVLRELGYVDQERLEQAVAIHVREILLGVFSWTDGLYSFEEQESGAFRGYDLTVKLATGSLILEAVRKVEDPKAVRYGLGDMDCTLIHSTDPLLRFQRLTLNSVDGFLLSRIDGSMSARDVVRTAPVPEAEAERSLLGLLSTGLVEYVPRATQETSGPALRRELIDLHKSLGVRDHFQVLGLSAEATDAQVKAAYFHLARRFHPDAAHDASLSDLREEIEAVFARISTAYHVLSRAQTRSSYESSLVALRQKATSPQTRRTPETGDADAASQRVQDALQKAEESYQSGRSWEAIHEVESVLSTATGRVRQRARVLLARCYLKNPKWRRMAEEELQEALHEEPGNVDACFLLGTLYKEGGLRARAATMFRKVLELSPQNTAAAAAELESLGEAAVAGGGSGLLKKLLR